MKRIYIASLLVGVLIGVAAGAAHASGGPLIFVANTSTEVSQADLVAALPAFQTAVSRDLAPAWGTDATLTTDPALEVRAAMRIELSDESDQCGLWGCALGYHDVIHRTPTARVFTHTSAQFNESWQLIFTHELFEMLVDPWINHFSLWNGRTWLVEVADPCESGYFAYFIDGVAISDFITPRWYNAKLPGPFDFTKHFKHAGQIGRHGYASYRDPSAIGGWGQIFG